MKTAILFSLPLAASAAVLDARQLGAAPVAGIDKLTPRIRPTAQRTLTKFGPYTLNGKSASKGSGGGGAMGGMAGMGGDSTLAGQSYFLNIKKGFCGGANENGPCTVYAGKVGVMFEDGTKADVSKGIYIHHVLTSDTTKRTPTFLSACNNPTSPGTSVSAMGSGTGFVGAGEDSGDNPVLYTARDGKSDVGYHVSKGDSFTAMVELVNYNADTKKIYLTYDLEYEPNKVGVNTKGTLISIQGCSKGNIKLSTTGPANTTSGKWTFLENGKLVAGRGHLHDGGVQEDLFLNDKFLCSSKATYGGDDSTASVAGQEWKTISSMSYCDGPIPIKKGDVLTMTVQYDLKRYPLRKSASGKEATGVMGMFSLTFAPSA